MVVTKNNVYKLSIDLFEYEKHSQVLRANVKNLPEGFRIQDVTIPFEVVGRRETKMFEYCQSDDNAEYTAYRSTDWKYILYLYYSP